MQNPEWLGGSDPLRSAGRGQPTQRYCPECGQPLDLGRSHAKGEHVRGVPYRSIFLVAVGLYLAVAFGGEAAWPGPPAPGEAPCSDTGVGRLCDAGVRSRALVIAMGKVPPADILAQQAVDRDLARAALGVIGIALGIGVIILRPRRSPGTNGAVVGVALCAEWVLAFFYVELVVLSVLRVAQDLPSGAPITLDSVRDDVDRVLTALILLARGS